MTTIITIDGGIGRALTALPALLYFAEKHKEEEFYFMIHGWDFLSWGFPQLQGRTFNPENKGILVCGSGIGISIAANKINGIRCALVHDYLSAKLSRQHNDSNIISLGAGFVGKELAKNIVDVFLSTDFTGEERHQRRIDKMTQLEK